MRELLMIARSGEEMPTLFQITPHDDNIDSPPITLSSATIATRRVITRLSSLICYH